MATKILDKACKCADCGEMMRAGSVFAWHKGTRSAVGGKVGGSYSLREVQTFRPKHAYDCYAAKVQSDARARRMAEIDHACQIAAQYGETQETVAAYRAKLIAEIS